MNQYLQFYHISAGIHKITAYPLHRQSKEGGYVSSDSNLSVSFPHDHYHLQRGEYAQTLHEDKQQLLNNHNLQKSLLRRLQY
jgi:hypothetical protein